MRYVFTFVILISLCVLAQADTITLQTTSEQDVTMTFVSQEIFSGLTPTEIFQRLVDNQIEAWEANQKSLREKDVVKAFRRANNTDKDKTEKGLGIQK